MIKSSEDKNYYFLKVAISLIAPIVTAVLSDL